MTATADVITLPVIRPIAVPSLSRDQRQAELVQLCWDVTVGTAPTPFVLRVAVAALAHESLRGIAADKAWRDYIGAENGFLDYEVDDTNFRGMDPGQARADRDDALRFLLDGAR